jgi:undecaprenyl-diphosphatase
MDLIVRFDNKFTSLIQELPPWIKPTMLFATFTGNIFPILSALCLCYLLGSTNNRIAVIFLALTILLNTALKQFIHRPRPDTLYVSLMRFKTHSFPSGHAFGTLTTYGFIAFLSLNNLAQPLNILVPILLGILMLLVGTSRVYLGAHYPTDVIGGWILGLACLLAAITIS